MAVCAGAKRRTRSCSGGAKEVAEVRVRCEGGAGARSDKMDDVAAVAAALLF